MNFRSFQGELEDIHQEKNAGIIEALGDPVVQQLLAFKGTLIGHNLIKAYGHKVPVIRKAMEQLAAGLVGLGARAGAMKQPLLSPPSRFVLSALSPDPDLVKMYQKAHKAGLELGPRGLHRLQEGTKALRPVLEEKSPVVADLVGPHARVIERTKLGPQAIDPLFMAPREGLEALGLEAKRLLRKVRPASMDIRSALREMEAEPRLVQKGVSKLGSAGMNRAQATVLGAMLGGGVGALSSTKVLGPETTKTSSVRLERRHKRFLGELVDRVEEAGADVKHMQVGGSGVVGALGKKRTNDLDVNVSSKRSFNRLTKLPGAEVDVKGKARRVRFQTPMGEIEAFHGPWSVGGRDFSKSDGLVEMHGVKHWSPKKTLEWKRLMDRPKDQKDIKLLSRHLKKESSMRGFAKSLERRSPEQLQKMITKLDDRVFREPLFSPRRSDPQWLNRTEAVGKLIDRAHKKQTGRLASGFRVGSGATSHPSLDRGTPFEFMK